MTVPKFWRLSHRLGDLGWSGPKTFPYPIRAFEYIILAFARSNWDSKREPWFKIVFIAGIWVQFSHQTPSHGLAVPAGTSARPRPACPGRRRGSPGCWLYKASTCAQHRAPLAALQRLLVHLLGLGQLTLVTVEAPKVIVCPCNTIVYNQSFEQNIRTSGCMLKKPSLC